MQRLGLTTDHRDQIDDLLDTWREYTSDRVIDLDEMRELERRLHAALEGAALVDDTVRHATTVLKTGATSPTAIRQRRDLDRLHGNMVAFPDTTKTRSDRGHDPSAA